MGDKLFFWIVEYHATRHFQHDVPQTQPLIKDGQEPVSHPGLLILQDGPGTLDRLIADDLIDPDLVGGEGSAETKKEFFDYLDETAHLDGVHILSGDRISGALTFDNKYGKRAARHLLPPDFFGTESVAEQQIGNKTRLAALLPQTLTDMSSYLLKQTLLNGTGSLAYFTRGGLAERVYFRPVTESSPQLVGVHQAYQSENGRYTFDKKEQIFRPSDFQPDYERKAA